MSDEKQQNDDKRNIYQRLNAVRSAVKYLQKDKKVQDYQAVTHDAVTAACREHLISHGVMIRPDQQHSEIADIGFTKHNTPIIRYSAWYNVYFINIDNPEDHTVVGIEAHANDHGDKAPGKALSYAVKYAMLKLLSIETGENEESRIDVAATPKQRMDQALAQEHVYAAVREIKTALDNGDMPTAAAAWFDKLDDDDKKAVWLAPTKGGIFTTQERETIKSTGFRQAYYGTQETE